MNISKEHSSVESRRTSRVTIIEVEGNIGAGKSTALAYIAVKGLPVYVEPILNWIDLLQLFYDDPAKYWFALQLQILQDLKKRYEHIIASFCGSYEYRSNIVYCERGLKGQRVFISVAKTSGYLNEREFAYLEKRIVEIENIVKDADVTIKTFYVDVDPVDCLRRIRVRGRECERDVSIEYLQDIADAYKKICDFDEIIDGKLSSEVEMSYDSDGNVTFDNKVAFTIYKRSFLDKIPRGIYYVDGNVGSGKSTFIRSLGSLVDGTAYKGILEQLDEKIVSAYYESPTERSLDLERHVTEKTIEKVSLAYATYNYDNVVFVERSPMIDDAFSRIRRALNYMTDDEVSMAIGERNVKLYSICKTPFLMNVYHVVLKCPTSECAKRVLKRDGRSVCEKFFQLVESESQKTFQSNGATCVSVDVGNATESIINTRDRILVELYKRLT